METTRTSPDCGFSESLAAFLYAECAPGEAAEFELHMSKCGTCAAEFDAMRQIREPLSALAAVAAPPRPISSAFLRPAQTDVTETAVPSFSIAAWFAVLMNRRTLAGAVAVGLISAGAVSLTLLAVLEETPRADDVAAVSTAKSPTSAEMPEKIGEVVVAPQPAVDVSSDSKSDPEPSNAAKGKSRRTSPQPVRENSRESDSLADVDAEELDDSLRLSDLFADIGT
jgi:hypothetical protein